MIETRSEEFWCVEEKMHLKHITLCTALSCWPMFLRNCYRLCNNSKGKRYRNKITQLIVPQLEDIAFRDLLFQQDSAPYHTAHEILNILHKSFSGQVISRLGCYDLAI